MTQLLLIRHAVNDFVKTGKLAGWTPEVHLNDEGKAQAAALGLRLAKTKIHAIYTSPLERTVETAQAVVAHHPELTLQLLEDIGEVRYGAWQGGELSKLSQRKRWRFVQGIPSRVEFPGGETMRGAQFRAVNAIEAIVEHHPRQTVAVVSHSDVIKMIVAHYLGMHLDLFQRIEISPASLTVLAIHGGRPAIVQINETAYLPEKKDDRDSRPVRSVTIGAIGQPGERAFYLQTQREGEDETPGELVTLALEKTQVGILAEEIHNLLDELAARQPPLAPAQASEAPELQSPESVRFRAGKFGLQYNAQRDLISVEIEELIGADQGTPAVFQLWATRPQIQTLGETALRVVRAGRRESEPT